MLKKRRKTRRDCNYIIYEMVDSAGASYIGLTRKTETTVARSVAERWRRHVSRAVHEDRAWALYQYLREGALEREWRHRVIAVVRGRAEAYAAERAIVLEQQPMLNDQYC